MLMRVYQLLVRVFIQNVHPRLSRMHIEARLHAVESGRNIDWATAEAMALGSLLLDGYNVRICGQDVVCRLCCDRCN